MLIDLSRIIFRRKEAYLKILDLFEELNLFEKYRVIF